MRYEEVCKKMCNGVREDRETKEENKNDDGKEKKSFTHSQK